MKRTLVTSALPYANGAIHLGHMLEFIQTDVYVRARRLAGDEVAFVWASDTHGTPIQIRAQKEGITPQELIAQAYDEHLGVFKDFGLGFDIFHSTDSPESKKHAYAIFDSMQDRGDIVTREVEQLYCPTDAMFLPDRFVKGTCPKCGASEQYGDVCEACGAVYEPTELKDPYCAVCEARGDTTSPVLKTSTHLFVPLNKHESFLREWVATAELQESVRNSLEGFLNNLRDWDISRDDPYFGFEIPGYSGKYFYVWFDAPVGYIGATEKWCSDNGQNVDEYWKSDAEIVHIIGKDIVYFHCLFWPTMLHSAGYTTPSRVQVHGWLMVNGKKMSKSRGTFILARTYLDHLPPYYLRYYFAAKLSGGQEDFDLSMKDFAYRVNADLVNKAANLMSRCVKFINGKLDGCLGEVPEDAEELLAEAEAKLETVPDLYRRFESGEALRIAIEIAENFNNYLSDKTFWKLEAEEARNVCTAALQASKMVAAILSPVIPEWGEKVSRMLHLDTLCFESAKGRLAHGTKIGPYETLAERLNVMTLDAIIEASKETT